MSSAIYIASNSTPKLLFDAVVAQGVGGPQRVQLGPGPAREPYDPPAALAADVDHPVDEVAPAQAHRFAHPQPTIIQKADQGMVARVPLDGIQEREDLAQPPSASA